MSSVLSFYQINQNIPSDRDSLDCSDWPVVIEQPGGAFHCVARVSLHQEAKAGGVIVLHTTPLKIENMEDGD